MLVCLGDAIKWNFTKFVIDKGGPKYFINEIFSRSDDSTLLLFPFSLSLFLDVGETIGWK